MTMKVLFVAPYAAMENSIQECWKEEPEINLDIKIGNLQEGAAIAKAARTQGFDVIISRGGTAKVIAEAVDIPVIDVHISGYDILRVLTLANDFPRKKAIVGFSNITLGAKSIIDLLEIPIDIFTINDEDETEPLLKQLKQDGYELIMGDVVTFETASRLGLLSILIQSGREAIFAAFKEAKVVSRWMAKKNTETELWKAMVEATGSDFIVIAENGEVVYEQWPSFHERPITELPVDIRENTGQFIYSMGEKGPQLKVNASQIAIHDTVYFIYEVSRLKNDGISGASLEVRTVSRPFVVHQSNAMNACLELIHQSISSEVFFLIGDKGTGKQLLAEYIHFHKCNGNGLFAFIKASDFIELNLEAVDHDLNTLYIHSMDGWKAELHEAFLEKFNTLRAMGKTIIFSGTTEAASWGSVLYGDETVRIYIPSLAERKEDISELAATFIAHFHQTLGTTAIKMKEESIILLEHYHWPGNVEELQALIKDAVLLEKGYVIEKKVMESLLNRKKNEGEQASIPFLTGTLEEIEKKIIEQVLKEEGFNQTKASQRLNINRSTLWRKLKG